MAAARPAARRSRSASSTPSPGSLATYGKQYIEGFKAGLVVRHRAAPTRSATARSRSPRSTTRATRPRRVSAAKDLIGKGIKIIAGSTASGVALQVAPLAAQNKVLFISGPAATDGDHRRRTSTRSAPAGSRTRTCSTAKSFIGDAAGKKVVVFAQDSAFGKANEAAVKAVIGGAGATVSSVLGPGQRHRVHPVRQPAQGGQARPALRGLGRHHRPGHVADARPAGRARLDHGRHRPGHPRLVADLRRRRRRRSRSCRTTSTAPATPRPPRRPKTAIPGGTLDLFHPDGFTAAQMVVRARRRRAATTSTRWSPRWRAGASTGSRAR